MSLRIAVTGGLGYIGSHTVIELISFGHSVFIFDNLSNSSEHIMSSIEKITGTLPDLFIGDIRDRDALKYFFSINSIDCVIHFAGLKSVQESEEFPLLYFDNNVNGSISLFNEALSAGVERFIFSSSATVYGIAENVKYKECTYLNPINVYGKTKLMVESILLEMKRAKPNLGVAILRYFNPVGADPSGLIGENPRGKPNNLMPFIADVASGIREKLFIYGGDYPTFDGTGLRDYIHVKDLALGHIAALNKLESNLIIANLGTGKAYSVLEIVRAFEKVSGKKIPLEIISRRPGDLAEYYADPSFAEEFLNWKAKFGIYDMCEDAWRWQKNKFFQ
jgi:UDP-glucose 4-epimerase